MLKSFLQHPKDSEMKNQGKADIPVLMRTPLKVVKVVKVVMVEEQNPTLLGEKTDLQVTAEVDMTEIVEVDTIEIAEVVMIETAEVDMTEAIVMKEVIDMTAEAVKTGTTVNLEREEDMIQKRDVVLLPVTIMKIPEIIGERMTILVNLEKDQDSIWHQGPNQLKMFLQIRKLPSLNLILLEGLAQERTF